MKILPDTNILLRASEPNHLHHSVYATALRALASAGHTFCISSQTISEFLAVATRSVTDRGLGMDLTRADAELEKVAASLETFYDSRSLQSFADLF